MCYIKKGIKRLICQIYRLLRNYTCTFCAEKFGDFLHNSKGGLGMIAIGADHGGYRLKEEIKKYFEEKGYKDAEVFIRQRDDVTAKNQVILDIEVDKKEKKKVRNIIIEANKGLSDKQIKG